MADDFENLLQKRVPTVERPLQGLTILVVEDSRYASEAMRLLCLRSGARIRRADSIASARRHLAAYRPAIVIIDIGLPDGSGLDLISELSSCNDSNAMLFGMSGEPGLREKSLAAGALDFIDKPLESLLIFQNAILKHLPSDEQPKGMRLVSEDEFVPDELALVDDLARVSDILHSTDVIDPDALAYAVQFLRGLARVAHDQPMEEVAGSMEKTQKNGKSIGDALDEFDGLVKKRIENRKIV